MHIAIFNVVVFVFLLPAIAWANDGDATIIIENTYRNAVVKIDVSSRSPVFNAKGENICRSEGTGFLVSKKHVITAAHVVNIDPRCDGKIIVVKSRKHNTQKAASVVSSGDDVALLQISPLKDTEKLCSLIIAARPIYATKGFRFGIPEGLEDPDPVALSIGEEDNQFKPLTVLRPSATHRGDSGGPVLRNFNVVGITKARHERYPDYSLMIGVNSIRKLLSAANITPDGSDCNPAKHQVDANFNNDKTINVRGRLIIDLPEELKASIKQNYFEQFASDFEVGGLAREWKGYKSAGEKLGPFSDISIRKSEYGKKDGTEMATLPAGDDKKATLDLVVNYEELFVNLDLSNANHIAYAYIMNTINKRQSKVLDNLWTSYMNELERKASRPRR